jgi:flagellar hook-associated protein 1
MDADMSLNSILNIAASGLQTSQTGIRTVSGNIANVNTPGYVRNEMTQQARLNGNMAAGVEVGAMRRAADRFLATTAWIAGAGSAASSMRSQYLGMIQSAFGDPTSSGSLFARMNQALGAFEAGAMNPGSLAARREAVADLNGFFGQLRQASEDVVRARADADRRIGETVGRINDLLQQIVQANGDVQQTALSGDSTGAEGRREGLINELSGLIDIRVTPRGDGTLEVRTTNGQLLAGGDAATLSFQPASAGASSFNRIRIAFGSDTLGRELEPSIQGGALRGLLDVRDGDLADIASALGELAGRTADALNAVHNQTSSLPPLASTHGSDTGLTGTDTLRFAGRTSIGIVDSAGILQRKIEIDFDAGTISVNGAVTGVTGATVADFTANLNAALGGAGTAGFSGGRLQLDATTPGTGLVFDEPATGGSVRGGRSFAAFFGLNDLVRTGAPSSFATGLAATDQHGFPAAPPLTFQLRGPSGEILATRSISLPAGGTMQDALDALNDVNSGLGMHGGFALDGSGRLTFTPNPGSGDVRLDLATDVGPRAGTSRSFGAMFGLSQAAREGRALDISVVPAITADPRKLGFAMPDLGPVAVGSVAVGMADSSGAQALFDVSRQAIDFSGSAIGGRAMTLADFAATVAGEVGTRAASAEADMESNEALKSEADQRRTNKEGVNLDEELVKLTTFQQAYAAAARMIQAADEMYDTLLRAI